VTYATYQWRFNGANIANATDSHYVIPAVPGAQATNAGDYSVAVTNAVGYIISSNAALTIIGSPMITTQPTSATKAETANHAFTVIASGASPLSYQWRFYATNLLAGQTNS